eukprot:854205-Amphidinium_carterae.1
MRTLRSLVDGFCCDRQSCKDLQSVAQHHPKYALVSFRSQPLTATAKNAAKNCKLSTQLSQLMVSAERVERATLRER